MWPILRPGDVVEHTPPTTVRVGDIVVWQAPWRGGGAFVHRVRRVFPGDVLSVAGDRESVARTISMSQVVGRVVALHRGRERVSQDRLRHRLVGIGARHAWRVGRVARRWLSRFAPA